ncbi:MAG: hypothetical protein JXQ29_18430 [Planctomycetes bacterium]|nr:hypothetical protein [Planctomycetota bacterium]
MGKRSGKAGSPVPPAGPDKAEDADVADPGEAAESKAAQMQSQSGKYGSQPLQPFKPAPNEEAEEPKTSWIEIQLVGEDDEGIPGEKYRITLPDGSVAEGTLDEKGLARVEGFEPGSCQVTFPELDAEAWEKV